jgi:26S proteasome regulatory subunit N9
VLPNNFQVFRTKTDPTKALEFLTPLLDQLKDEPHSQDAYALILAESSLYKLKLQQLEDCKEGLKACEKVLEGLTSSDPIINASFYRVSADYYKVSYSDTGD